MYFSEDCWETMKLRGRQKNILGQQPGRALKLIKLFQYMFAETREETGTGHSETTSVIPEMALNKKMLKGTETERLGLPNLRTA